MKSSYVHFSPLIFFSKNRKITSFLSILISVSLLNLVTSCNYYTVRDLTTTSETISDQVEEFNQEQKYAVIHSGNEIWHLDNIVLNEDSQTISGTNKQIDQSHIPLKPRDSKRVHRYHRKQKPLNEVHFYLKDSISANYGNETTIPISSIDKVSINDRNVGRSMANAFLGTLGVLTGLLIIVALTKSSCPFIYVNNGEEFVFAGELYPGVLTANQQRDDFIKLPNRLNKQDVYSIKITNELKEIQYTDLAQLVQIEHPFDTEVLLDQFGKPLTFSDLKSPHESSIEGHDSQLEALLHKDENYHLFNSEASESSSLSSIDLKFNNPTNRQTAKLYLTVKNSMWLDYIFGKFNEQFGSYYKEFQKDQQEYTKQQSEKWIREQNIPLSIYLKTIHGWKLVERINTVGPMASREVAVAVDLSDAGNGDIEIKLETGFMFWELDYAAIDYSKNVPVTIKYINPTEAIDSNGNVEALKLLSKADNEYLVQPNVGDQVLVNYDLPKTEVGTTTTYYLKNRGYYNYIRDYKGKPNLQKLRLFKEANAFTDFSKFEYQAFREHEKELNSNAFIE